MKRKIITKFEQPYPDEYYYTDLKQQQDFKTQIPYKIEQEYIPEDPYEFYEDFGYLKHPKTGEPVEHLTPYQYNIWNTSNKIKTTIVVKPQKSGVTTSCLLQDFQTAITKGRGKDILIIGQTLNQANQHIRTLKLMIIGSEKYRKYLITEPKELYFKEEKTKVSVIYIKNPDNPFQPSRIIATPFTDQGVWSWKNVYRIHMSDTAVSGTIEDKAIYDAAGTRFANTEGYWLIESPPHGTRNHYFQLYEDYKYNQDPNVKVIVVDIEEAIANKVVSREFIESERTRLKHTFAQYYGSSFLETEGNLFSIESIDKAISLGEKFNPSEFRQNSIKIITVDQGYSSSKFVILVIEWNREHRLLRVLHGEEHQSPQFEFMINRVLQLRKEYGNVLNIFYDSTSRQEFGTALKTKIDEKPYYWPQIKQKMEECIRRGIPIEKRMVVVPVIFSTNSKLEMSAKLQQILDDSRGLIAIPSRFDKLINSLKGAVFDDRGMLDKNLSLDNDWLDCLFMSTKFFKFGNN